MSIYIYSLCKNSAFKELIRLKEVLRWNLILYDHCPYKKRRLGNSAVATGLKKLVFIPIVKKGNPKECSNYHTIALISHASKVMLKILQARLQLYVNHEFPDVQAGFRKGRGTRD